MGLSAHAGWMLTVLNCDTQSHPDTFFFFFLISFFQPHANISSRAKSKQTLAHATRNDTHTQTRDLENSGKPLQTPSHRQTVMHVSHHSSNELEEWLKDWQINWNFPPCVSSCDILPAGIRAHTCSHFNTHTRLSHSHWSQRGKLDRTRSEQRVETVRKSHVK